ncbi:Uncharacterized protein TCM_038927 [Theobroma cacao]|uniref:Uncharacterized protein n=1 Tax=Theobroma cacao TaxID=3641 RepID=A0A061GQK7_THECC|nr:Uncharacterized protein TCM_038927 [Theobroma cacao]
MTGSRRSCPVACSNCFQLVCCHVEGFQLPEFQTSESLISADEEFYPEEPMPEPQQSQFMASNSGVKVEEMDVDEEEAGPFRAQRQSAAPTISKWAERFQEFHASIV